MTDKKKLNDEELDQVAGGLLYNNGVDCVQNQAMKRNAPVANKVRAAENGFGLAENLARACESNAKKNIAM